MFLSSVDCCTGFTAGRLLFFSGFAARVNGLCGSNFAKKNKRLLVVCTADTHRVQHITTQIQLPWPTRFFQKGKRQIQDTFKSDPVDGDVHNQLDDLKTSNITHRGGASHAFANCNCSKSFANFNERLKQEFVCHVLNQSSRVYSLPTHSTVATICLSFLSKYT